MRLFIFASLLLRFACLPAQWTNLGTQSIPIVMTSDYHGLRFTNVPGPTPSNGSVWTAYGTDDDWVTEGARSSGGGGSLGCCTVELVDFLNDSVGFMEVSNMGFRGVQRTTDAGMTWTPMAQGGQTASVPIADLQGYNDTTAYLIGHGSGVSSAVALRFTPSGHVPVFASSTHEGGDGRILFVTDSLGFVIVHDTADVYKVFRTTDGGATWSIRLSVGIGALRAMEFLTPQKGFVVGHSGVGYETTDGGFTWNSMAVTGPVDVNAIDFLDAQTGYLACEGGVVLRTTNGGFNWSTDLIDSSLSLVAVKAVTAGIAYVITADSVVYKRNYVAGEDGSVSGGVRARMRVYPNPTDGVLHFALPAGERMWMWRLWDVQGRLMREGSGMEVDMGELGPGVYMLEVEGAKGKSLVRVMRN
jgi:photosystem II stability/assembly factor-like uncharacterized protein